MVDLLAPEQDGFHQGRSFLGLGADGPRYLGTDSSSHPRGHPCRKGCQELQRFWDEVPPARPPRCYLLLQLFSLLDLVTVQLRFSPARPVGSLFAGVVAVLAPPVAALDRDGQVAGRILAARWYLESVRHTGSSHHCWQP
jgi:hypothetical protein